jgi:hypothetical protein
VAGLTLAGALAIAPTASASTINIGVVKASQYASARGFINAVTVMDMKTGQTWQAGSTTRLFGAGSVTKVLIATKILATGNMSGNVETQAYSMVTRSDDNAATNLWERFGSTGIIGWVKKYYGISDLGTTNTEPGFWGNTHITSHGIAELYYHILRDPKVGPWLVNAMHHYNCNATDGTNQCFGIPQATSGAGIKQGWSAGYGSADNRNDSIIHTTGLVDSNRYAVVILTEGVGTAGQSGPTGVVPAEANAVTAMAKLVLPGGKVAPISVTAASAVADVNGDGRADLVATKTDGSLWLYLNNGDPTHPYSTGRKIGLTGWQGYNRIVAADVDGNHEADLIATRPDGTLWLYRNTGNATHPYATGTQIGSSGWNGFDRIEAADVDGNGRADLLTTKATGALWLYRNNGSNTHPFSTGQVIGQSGWQAFDRLASADVDGNHRADLIGTQPDGTLWLYRNNGSNTHPFSTGQEIGQSGWQAFDRLVVGDVDGNGRADLLATKSTGALWLYRNAGSNTYPFPGGHEIGSSGWQAFNRLF